jgi:hypothetical protein
MMMMMMMVSSLKERKKVYRTFGKDSVPCCWVRWTDSRLEISAVSGEAKSVRGGFGGSLLCRFCAPRLCLYGVGW